MRRIAKWAGLVTVITFGAVWALSLRFNATWNCGRGYLGVTTGGIHAKWPAEAAIIRWQPSGVIVDARVDAMWWPSIVKSRVSIRRRLVTVLWTAKLPIWMLFVVAAVPTAFLWWRDRRGVPPGACRSCGYDLTGNVSGVCPECGKGL